MSLLTLYSVIIIDEFPFLSDPYMETEVQSWRWTCCLGRHCPLAFIFRQRMEETRTRKYEATPLSLTLQEKYCSLHCKLLQQSQYNIILFVGLSRCPTSSESAGTEFYLWPGYSPAFLLSFPCLHYRSLPYRSWPETSFLEVSKYSYCYFTFFKYSKQVCVSW